ncbi:hypothetical protein, partial [Burkholderia pseudomallei]|uniref:hypothetical protein n=1 Tax=Burkholderia pseudomallei TaxID=28450 RepID=UPI001C4BB5C1
MGDLRFGHRMVVIAVSHGASTCISDALSLQVCVLPCHVGSPAPRDKVRSYTSEHTKPGNASGRRQYESDHRTSSTTGKYL